MNMRWIGCVCALTATSACGQAASPDSHEKTASLGDVEDVDTTGEALGLHRQSGAVFTQTNDAACNQVVAFERSRDGTLTHAGEYSTGGKGSSNGLGSQGAVALSTDHRYLFAVNAGSNEISAFRVRGAGLTLTDHVASLGTRPVSVTEHEGIVYVLNSDNLSGFRLDRHGHLQPLAGAVLPLSGSAVGPAQVQFSADGRRLLVTEKATNVLDTYRVSSRGIAEGPAVHASLGTTPFGFDITRRGVAVVSEAATGSASSYAFAHNNGLTPITAALASGERAPCWVTITPDDRFAFVANAQTSSISTYSIARNGELALYDSQGGSTGEGGRPLDLALDDRGDHLYVLDAGHHQVAHFAVSDNAALEPLMPADIPAPTMAGIAAY
jgi:6-phosphogluconolactonase (cycloisomerase 2 family)